MNDKDHQYDTSEDEEDDDDLPVIAIDRVRAVIRPDQLQEDYSRLDGIRVGGPSNIDLPFHFDEDDTLLMETTENSTTDNIIGNNIEIEAQKIINNNNNNTSTTQSSPLNTVESANITVPESTIPTSTKQNAVVNNTETTTNRGSSSPMSNHSTKSSSTTSSTTETEKSESDFYDDISILLESDDDMVSVEGSIQSDTPQLATQVEHEEVNVKEVPLLKINQDEQDVNDVEDVNIQNQQSTSNNDVASSSSTMSAQQDDLMKELFGVDVVSVHSVSPQQHNDEDTDSEYDRKMEMYLMNKLDNSILEAEERELFLRYETNITVAEIEEQEMEENVQLEIDEKSMLERYEKRISDAEKREKEKEKTTQRMQSTSRLNVTTLGSRQDLENTDGVEPIVNERIRETIVHDVNDKLKKGTPNSNVTNDNLVLNTTNFDTPSNECQYEHGNDCITDNAEPLFMKRPQVVLLDDNDYWSDMDERYGPYCMASRNTMETEHRWDQLTPNNDQLRRFSDIALTSDSSKTELYGVLAGSVESIRLGRGSKIVPRILEPGTTNEFLSCDIIQRDFLPSLRTKKIFETLILNTRNLNETSIVVECVGPYDIVKLALPKLKVWISERLSLYKYISIRQDGTQKTLILESKKPLGIRLDDCVVNGKTIGLFIGYIDPHEQVAKALGISFHRYGAVVVSLNDVKCRNFQAFKNIKKRVDDSNQVLKLRLCFLSHSTKPVSETISLDEAVSSLKTTILNTSKSKFVDLDLTSSQHHHDVPSQINSNSHTLGQENTQNISRETMSTDSTKESLQYYQHFNKKYREIVSEEFQGTIIKQMSAMTRMWKRHQLRYSSCNEKCKCYLDLTYLTETITSDHFLMTHRKVHDLIDGKYPVGVVSFFADKFIKKLVAEYPNESSSKTLRRLHAMWQLHLQNVEYGSKCSSTCNCINGWVKVFQKGDVLVAKTDTKKNIKNAKVAGNPKSIAKGENAAKTQAHELKDGTRDKKTPTVKSVSKKVENGEEIKKKGLGKPPDKSAREVTRTESTAILCDDMLPRKKKKKLMSRKSPSHDTTHYVDFDIIYDCRKALGFYSGTKKDDSGNPYCSVISVCPIGQNATDRRIQCRSKVISVRSEESSEWKQLLTHTDLKEKFDEGRLKGSKLELKFINTYVTSESVAKAIETQHKCWTSKGQWKGKEKFGWDGGAAVIDPQNSINAQWSSKIPSSDQPNMNPLPTQVASSAPQVGSSLDIVTSSFAQDPSWTTLHVPRLLSQELRPSILRQRASSVSKKSASASRIRFSDSNETRRYDVKSLPFHFFVRSDSSDVGTEAETQPQSRPDFAPDVLTEIIHNGSCKDLMRHFESGTLENVTSVEILKESRNLVKTEKEKIQAVFDTCPHDRTLVDRINDFERKDVVLKVYLNAFYISHQSRALKQYERFAIIVHRIEDLSFSPIVKPTSQSQLRAEVTVAYDRNSVPEILSRLPTLPLLSTIDYGNNYIPFHMNHNPVLTPDRTMDVCLTMMNPDQSPLSLGAIEIRTSDLHLQCLHSREWFNITIESLPNDYIKSAKLLLQVRKVPLDPPDYIEKKRRALCSMLYTVTEWIDRFNNELVSSGHPSPKDYFFSADVRVTDNASLLHSAIFLRDVKLIQKLLDQGANPHAKSKIGSAITLVYNMTGRVPTTTNQNLINYDSAIATDQNQNDNIAGGLNGKTGEQQTTTAGSVLDRIYVLLYQHSLRSVTDDHLL